MSLFTEPVWSSHVHTRHVPNAGMAGSVGEVATQEDWPSFVRSTTMQGVPTGTGDPYIPTASVPTLTIPTGDFGNAFFPSAGLNTLGDSSDTANAAAAAPPTVDQTGTNFFKNKLFLGAALIAGAFLVMSAIKKR